MSGMTIDWPKQKALFRDFLTRQRLSGVTLAVGLLLVDHVNTNPNNPRYGKAWPSIETMVAELHASKRAIIYAIHGLHDRGLFKVAFARGRGKHNTYVGVWKLIKDEKVQGSAPLPVIPTEKVQIPAQKRCKKLHPILFIEPP